ncbi:glyceraldehyde-3-phosphate dehydrogenase [Sigmodon hispidus]
MMATRLPGTSSLHPLVLPSETEAHWPGLLCSTLNVSVMDLTCWLDKAVKYDDIQKVMKQASTGPLNGILSYPDDQVVSCNFNSDACSSNLDAGSGIAFNDNFIKLISWYYNMYDGEPHGLYGFYGEDALDHSPRKYMRATERPLVTGESLSQLSLQH